MTFAEALKRQMISRKKITGKAKRLFEILNDKPSKRRTRILNRLEAHAKIQLEDHDIDIVDGDWSEIEEKDWTAFFDGLLKLLLAILPMILQLFSSSVNGVS